MNSYPRVYGLLLVLMLLTGLGFIAVTPGMLQIDPTQQQGTLDAAVEQLFTATEQAKITQTVDAAFKQALTGTAAALATPTPTATYTPEAFRVDSLFVLDSQTIDLLAGPGRTGAYLAPNGEIFAHLQREEICIYTIAGEEQQCIPFDPQFEGLEPDSIRWSPDSRYLVMTSDFFRFFIEPDLYVLDLEAGRMTNVTNDRALEFEIGKQAEFAGMIDVAPRWHGEYIYFIRYTQNAGVFNPPMLWRIKANGSGAERVGTFTALDRFSIYAFAISPDGTRVAYNFFVPGNDKPQNGIWISDLDGGNAEQLASLPQYLTPWTLEFSPDGSYVLTNSGLSGRGSEPAQSPVRVIALADERVSQISETLFVTGAGWSPTGSALVYSVRDPQNPDVDGLYLTNEPGQSGTLLEAGAFIVPTGRAAQAIIWTANNVLLLSNMPEASMTVLQLGTE